jgi:hypothetical protein
MLVVHHRRAGGQSQHSAILQLDAKSDRVQIAALLYVSGVTVFSCWERLSLR